MDSIAAHNLLTSIAHSSVTAALIHPCPHVLLPLVPSLYISNSVRRSKKIYSTIDFFERPVRLLEPGQRLQGALSLLNRMESRQNKDTGYYRLGYPYSRPPDLISVATTSIIHFNTRHTPNVYMRTFSSACASPSTIIPSVETCLPPRDNFNHADFCRFRPIEVFTSAYNPLRYRRRVDSSAPGRIHSIE